MPPDSAHLEAHPALLSPPPASRKDDLRKPLLEPSAEQQEISLGNGVDPEPASTIFGQLKRLLFLALPLAAQFVATLALPVISNISVGHLNDPLKLSSAMLGSSFFMVTGWSVLMGISTAQDTIVGQAHGAQNYVLVGLTLQRGILVSWSLCIPMVLLWWNAAPVLTALGLEPEIVSHTSHYLRMLSPTIFSTAIVVNMQRWLVSQRVVHIASTSVVVAALLSPVFNWFFIYYLNWDMFGAATAFFCAFTTYAALMSILAALRIRKLTGPAAQVWTGFSLEAFSGWWHYLSYGIPAAVMMCCEMWVVEAMLFMNGFLPNAEVAVAVMGITQNINHLSAMAVDSVGIACSTVIANALGAGHPNVGRTTFLAGAYGAVVIQMVLATPLYLLRDQVPLLFTHAPEVVELACHTLPVMVLSLLADSVTELFSGALRGIGRQKWGALLNLTAYWLVGLPISVTLGLKYQLGPRGFWWGMAVANWVQMTIQAVLLFRLDWDIEVARARALTAPHQSKQHKNQQEEPFERHLSIEDNLIIATAISPSAILNAAFLHTTSNLSAGTSDHDDLEANWMTSSLSVGTSAAAQSSTVICSSNDSQLAHNDSTQSRLSDT